MVSDENKGVPCEHPRPLVDGWGTDLNDPLQPDLTEPLRFVGEVRRLGVALVNVSMGNAYAAPHILRPFEYPPPDGYETPEHPLAGVDRHFRFTAQVQSAYRSDSNDSIYFVAPAREQLALVTDDRFHGSSSC